MPIIILFIALIVSSCTLFTSPYDAVRHQNLTQLKAFHLKFLQDWTQNAAPSWQIKSVSQFCDEGDLRFREAFEYAASLDKNDKTSGNAVQILWKQFAADCTFLIKRNKPISPAFAEEMTKEVRKNYDLAIQGELYRNQ